MDPARPPEGLSLQEGTAMTHREQAGRVAQTLLYEGYVLYPYRASAAKNRCRWTFGCLFPDAFGGEPSALRVQCLLRGAHEAVVETCVRFLHVAERGHWQEAIERECGPGAFALEAGDDGVRTWRALQGEVAVTREPVAADASRLTVRVVNRTPLPAGASRADAQRCALASTHVLLHCGPGAQFVSMTDPPPDLREAAAACRNEGAWPVLIGSQTASDTMLASPIIVGDDPQVAPESPGALYDGTEIDEILSLRVLTLTDDERREALALDDRTRAVIERVESLAPQQWAALHGTFRDPLALRPGDRVRIRPRPGADILDLALAGKVAVVDSVEHDFDERVHVAVALEDDPGRDLGLARLPGHRFFFSPGELERVR
jgi:hydrogenase maturation protease